MSTFIIYIILLIILSFFDTNQRRKFITRDIFGIPDLNSTRERQRDIALKRAALFLSPYNSKWNNLKIGNKHCYAELKNGRINCKNRSEEEVYFIVKPTQTTTIDDLWDLLCITFDYNTSYRGLVEFFQRQNCRIIETNKSKLYNSKYGTYSNSLIENNSNTKNVHKPIVKVDINNCSEIEMTALPGINVIMSKRAIKKREEIGGFKKIEDFFLYLHIKPHLKKQLEERICLNKMKGFVKLQRNSERSVDL